LVLSTRATAGNAATVTALVEGLLGEAQHMLSAESEKYDEETQAMEMEEGGADCWREMAQTTHELKMELALLVVSQLAHLAAESALLMGPRLQHLVRVLARQVDSKCLHQKQSTRAPWQGGL
jgi:hypothetical protein